MDKTSYGQKVLLKKRPMDKTSYGKNVLRTKRPTDKTSYDKTFHVDNSLRPTTKHPTQDKKRTIFAFRSKFELYGIKIPYFCVSSLANFFVLTYVDKALAAIKRTLSREKLGVFVIRDVALGLSNWTANSFIIVLILRSKSYYNCCCFNVKTVC